MKICLVKMQHGLLVSITFYTAVSVMVMVTLALLGDVFSIFRFVMISFSNFRFVLINFLLHRNCS